MSYDPGCFGFSKPEKSRWADGWHQASHTPSPTVPRAPGNRLPGWFVIAALLAALAFWWHIKGSNEPPKFDASTTLTP